MDGGTTATTRRVGSGVTTKGERNARCAESANDFTRGMKKIRDINRIQPMMYELGNVWEACFPDMRFMQMIVNFQSWLGSDGFYIEDDNLLEKLCDYANEMLRRKLNGQDNI